MLSRSSQKWKDPSTLRWLLGLFLCLMLADAARSADEIVSYPLDADFTRIDIATARKLTTAPEETLEHVIAQFPDKGQSFDARYLVNGTETVWIHFRLQNLDNRARQIVLNHAFALTPRFEIYTQDTQGLHSIGAFGDAVADRAPQVWHRTPSIRLELQPGFTDFYIKVEDGNPQCLLFKVYSYDAFQSMHAKDLALLCTLIGVIVIMLLYNVFIYLSLRYDYYLYYIGFGTVFYLCYVILSGLPQASFFSQWEGRNISLYGAASFGCFSFYFICQFANSFLNVDKFFPLSAKITKIFGYSIFAFLPFCLFEALYFRSSYSVKAINFTGSIIGCWIYFVAVCVAFKRYPPAYYFIIAFTTLVIGNTYSTSVVDGIFPLSDYFAYSALLGGTCEILLLSISLGKRVKDEEAQSKNKVQEMAAELGRINHDLDQRIEERTRFARSILNSMNIGLLRIEASGRIANDFSKVALELFSKKDFKDKYIWDLFDFDHEGESLSIFKSLIDLIIGEDQANLLLNEDLLPKSHRAGDRLIELNWSPFLNGNQVEAILLLARDVTYVTGLEQERKGQLDQANFIMLVAKHGVEKMQNYLQEEIQGLQRARRILASTTMFAIIEKFGTLRIIHTIKGNTRSFGLSEISKICHTLEDSILASRSQPLLQSQALGLIDTMAAQLLSYEQMIQKYFVAEIQRFSRPLQALEGKIQTLKASEHRESLKLADEMQWIITAMNYDLLGEINLVLKDQIDDLALQLNKDPPELRIQADRILIESKKVHRLHSILNHLIRNAVDHGIEPRDIRLAKGKDSKGLIEIQYYARDGRMICAIRDDGAGLQLDRLYNKYLQDHKLPKGTRPTMGTIANLVFKSGLSVKDEATSISGRGIGMDAVRDLCLEIGAEISIRMDQHLSHQPYEPGQGLVAIWFEIDLPMDLFLVQTPNESISIAS